jgi:hypothetical protein
VIVEWDDMQGAHALQKMARQLIHAKSELTRARSADHYRRPRYQMRITLAVKPIEGCQSTASRVDGWRRHDEDHVGLVEHTGHRGVHQAGAAVGEDDVVEALKGAASSTDPGRPFDRIWCGIHLPRDPALERFASDRT